ncbi:MAG TPA: AraC family transcriptional regulator [Gemmatimonadaceae bacterium]|nr:AraC family transcriptional regulator [Gemmatimonadaceae bacterium]
MHDSPPVNPSHQLGGYHEFGPPPDLADAVEALWIHQAADVHVASHRVVPDAAVSLCFMGRRASDGSAGDARLRIIGPVLRPHEFAPPPGHRMESVRIKLEWCRPLLGVAPGEQLDAEPLYADVRRDLAAPLESQLARTTTSVDAVRVLVNFLRARRHLHPRAATLLIAGMHSLRHGDGQPRVAELATRLGVSDRHLRRLVVDETGVSPRQFARIQRFHALLRCADAASSPAWAALAFQHGYADQPHLIREVQDLAGVTPARLHAERRAE